jgi:hypothetical protein
VQGFQRVLSGVQGRSRGAVEADPDHPRTEEDLVSRTRRLTALCLTVAALAPASALAYQPPADGPYGDPQDLEGLDPSPTRTIVVAGSDGIDWADAGAGFAAAACLGLLAAGAVATIRQPRRRA